MCAAKDESGADGFKPPSRDNFFILKWEDFGREDRFYVKRDGTTLDSVVLQESYHDLREVAESGVVPLIAREDSVPLEVAVLDAIARVLWKVLDAPGVSFILKKEDEDERKISYGTPDERLVLLVERVENRFVLRTPDKGKSECGFDEDTAKTDSKDEKECIKNGNRLTKTGSDPAQAIGPDHTDNKLSPQRTESRFAGDLVETKFAADRMEKRYAEDRTERRFAGDSAENRFAVATAGNRFADGRTESRFAGDTEENRFTGDTMENRYAKDRTESRFADDRRERRFAGDSAENRFAVATAGNRFADDRTESRFAGDTVENRFAVATAGNRFADDRTESRFADDRTESRFSGDTVKNRCAGDAMENRYAKDRTESRFVGDSVENRFADDRTECRLSGDTVESKFAGDMMENRYAKDRTESRFAGDSVENRFAIAMAGNRFADDRTESRFAGDTIENGYAKDRTESRFAGDRTESRFAGDTVENTYAKDKTESRYAVDSAENRFAGGTMENRFADDRTESRFSGDSVENRFANETKESTFAYNTKKDLSRPKRDSKMKNSSARNWTTRTKHQMVLGENFRLLKRPEAPLQRDEQNYGTVNKDTRTLVEGPSSVTVSERLNESYLQIDERKNGAVNKDSRTLAEGPSSVTISERLNESSLQIDERNDGFSDCFFQSLKDFLGFEIPVLDFRTRIAEQVKEDFTIAIYSHCNNDMMSSTFPRGLNDEAETENPFQSESWKFDEESDVDLRTTEELTKEQRHRQRMDGFTAALFKINERLDLQSNGCLRISLEPFLATKYDGILLQGDLKTVLGSFPTGFSCSFELFLDGRGGVTPLDLKFTASISLHNPASSSEVRTAPRGPHVRYSLIHRTFTLVGHILLNSKGNESLPDFDRSTDEVRHHCVPKTRVFGLPSRDEYVLQRADGPHEILKGVRYPPSEF